MCFVLCQHSLKLLVCLPLVILFFFPLSRLFIFNETQVMRPRNFGLPLARPLLPPAPLGEKACLLIVIQNDKVKEDYKIRL